MYYFSDFNPIVLDDDEEDEDDDLLAEPAHLRKSDGAENADVVEELKPEPMARYLCVTSRDPGVSCKVSGITSPRYSCLREGRASTDPYFSLLF